MKKAVNECGLEKSCEVYKVRECESNEYETKWQTVRARVGNIWPSGSFDLAHKGG